MEGTAAEEGGGRKTWSSSSPPPNSTSDVDKDLKSQNAYSQGSDENCLQLIKFHPTLRKTLVVCVRVRVCVCVLLRKVCELLLSKLTPCVCVCVCVSMCVRPAECVCVRACVCASPSEHGWCGRVSVFSQPNTRCRTCSLGETRLACDLRRRRENDVSSAHAQRHACCTLHASTVTFNASCIECETVLDDVTYVIQSAQLLP